MNQGRTVFSQLIGFLPDREFRRCAERYQGDSRLRGFSCWDQYLAMAFAQLTYRESLRDIEACLHSMQSKLYHLGFRGKVARSTLADATESHDWRIFAPTARAPVTAAKERMIERTRTELEQWVCDLQEDPQRVLKSAAKLWTAKELAAKYNLTQLSDKKYTDAPLMGKKLSHYFQQWGFSGKAKKAKPVKTLSRIWIISRDPAEIARLNKLSEPEILSVHREEHPKPSEPKYAGDE
jgi:Domain of unknown function (DUF4372)